MKKKSESSKENTQAQAERLAFAATLKNIRGETFFYDGIRFKIMKISKVTGYVMCREVGELSRIKKNFDPREVWKQYLENEDNTGEVDG